MAIRKQVVNGKVNVVEFLAGLPRHAPICTQSPSERTCEDYWLQAFQEISADWLTIKLTEQRVQSPHKKKDTELIVQKSH